MTSENKAPDCGHPFCGGTCGSAAIEAQHTQRELTQIDEASASVRSRQNALIETLRAELAAEKVKGARLVIAAKDAIVDACADDLHPWFAELRAAITAYEVKP